ncbi:MAG: SdrD B-like domain-containing protein [Gemmatimonadales bacterium]
MNRAFLGLSLAIAVISAVSCNDDKIGLVEGTASTLNVRVYVDANGNGSFDSGVDVPIASVTVTVTSDGTQVAEDTDASGLATFQLAPGSYEITVSGAAPTGAVLATSGKPTIAAPFQGGTIEAEFRYAFLPGVLSGVVFRDDNGDSVFNAADDTPAPGIQLTLFSGQGTAGDTVGQTTTDAAGAYMFDTLRPGDYTLEIIPLPSMTIVGGVTQSVTVAADVQASLPIEFTGELLVTTSDARNLPDGRTVTLEGVVTWQAQWDNRQYFLQDGTAGIAVFDGDTTAFKATGGLQIGDSIRITGTKSSFRSEVQLNNIVTVQALGAVGEPTARPVTGAEINAGSFQGQFVTIDGKVDSLQIFSFDNHTVFITDAAGTTFTAFVDSRTGIASTDWTVGTDVTLKGVLGFDDRNTLSARLELRQPSDLALGGAVTSIADARTMSGASVFIEGVVTWQQSWDSRVYFLQDATGGISAFDGSRVAGTLAEGDRIRVVGTVGAFRGETQISPVTQVFPLGNEAVPLPRVVTGTQINAGMFQGQLVTVSGTVDSLQVFSFDNHMVFLTDGAGVIFTVFVDSRTGQASTGWTVGQTVQVSGVLGTDDRNAIAPRIELRKPADMAVAVSSVTIAAARGMAAGTTVMLQGVVTWQAQWDDRVYFFEDGTGGISVFDSNAPLLKEGYVIQITGTLGAFRGETQISSISQLTVLGQQTLPTPRSVTAAEVNGGQFQGQLVKASGSVTSVAVDGFGTQTVSIDDGTGTVFTVFADNRTGLTAGMWVVGAHYDVVGVLGTDDRNTPAPRIEARFTTDVGTNISSARGMGGQVVAVQGVVTWQQPWDSRVYFFQDGTAGLSAFDGNSVAGTLQRGDRILVVGTAGAFRGETQVSSVTDVIALGSESVPAPRSVTGAQVNAGSFQGELVSVSGTVDSVQVFSFDNHMVFLTDGSGTTFTVFVDSRNGRASADWTVGASVTVTGVLGTDDRNALAARIELRDPQDVN